ncbi:MAG TPA: AI-2E family transporter [Bradyrhizobium sp.]|uniref:AI-2E family transporter n=1 Tax=Bradyrhizobium sp. TaxID=376 RepID=UPI002B805AB0|nr:AI-2E family transporter [Bradyrhizobium sp.]HLZ01691.1 AI-2E family transporter [Bradyrhizobium sp.]
MTDVSSPLNFKARRPEISTPRLSSSSAGAVFVGLAIVAVLYFGRDIFVPIALAILLSFALAPLVQLLRRWHVPRLGAVIVTVLVALLVIFAIGTTMTRQITQLAEDIPRYQITISQKIESVRDAAGSGGIVQRITGVFENLRNQISRPTTPKETGAPKAPSDTGEQSETKPVRVEVQRPSPKPIEIIQSVVGPILGPLATTGIVVIFAIFILLYRQDLRDRLIRLAGSHDLGRTTEAMDDAAHRLSRYFLAQLVLNASFGVIIGTGLLFIGVPNPLLWGIFAALMRFVPYIGAFIAALFPAALAIAVDPGWSMLIWTVALFAVVEPVMGQLVEPWLYGHNTGLSPVAVVVAATFWTWLWGPIGLLLSTPLTVCLVVVGRHVEHLAFLEVILGDEPALTPEENFYQRMLAGDPHEAADQAEVALKERSLSAYYDEVAMRGLALAQADLSHGSIDLEKLVLIRDTAYEVIDDLSDHDDEIPSAKREMKEGESPSGSRPSAETNVVPAVVQKEQLAPIWREGTPVLCIGGRSPLDEAAAAMLAQLLEKHGMGARVEPREALETVNIFRLDVTGVVMVCLSYLDASKPAVARYLVRRLRRKLPKALILVGFWGLKKDGVGKELQTSEGADLYATSLVEAVNLCIEVARVAVEHEAPARPGAESSTNQQSSAA